MRKNPRLLKNSEADIIAAFPKSDPKDRTKLYIPLKAKAGQSELNYEVIDIKNKFDDNILNDPDALNRMLTEYISRTIGGITSAAAFNN